MIVIPQDPPFTFSSSGYYLLDVFRLPFRSSIHGWVQVYRRQLPLTSPSHITKSLSPLAFVSIILMAHRTLTSMFSQRIGLTAYQRIRVRTATISSCSFRLIYQAHNRSIRFTSYTITTALLVCRLLLLFDFTIQLLAQVSHSTYPLCRLGKLILFHDPPRDVDIAMERVPFSSIVYFPERLGLLIISINTSGGQGTNSSRS